MGLFGKKKLSEIESAGQFVLMVTRNSQQYWPTFAKDLNSISQAENPIPDNQQAAFEFVLAVIAIQIQALPNLFPSDQASRIRECVMRCISSPELGVYPRETIQEYQNAWDQSLKHNVPPFDGIASILFDKLGCRDSVKISSVSFKSPILLMALSEKVVTFGGPWWKTVSQQYKLVP